MSYCFKMAILAEICIKIKIRLTSYKLRQQFVPLLSFHEKLLVSNFHAFPISYNGKWSKIVTKYGITFVNLDGFAKFFFYFNVDAICHRTNKNYLKSIYTLPYFLND